MQSVQVINTRTSDTAILGLGKVAAGTSKTGFIPQIVFDPDQDAYSARAAFAGIAIRDLSGLTPFTQTGREDFTAADTVANDTRLVLLTASSANYATALPAASDVPAGDVIYFYFLTGGFEVSLTLDGTDTLEGADVYDLAATAADNTGAGFAIATNNAITRNDGGSWVTDGYVQGGRVVIQDAEDVANNGTFTIATVTASVLTVTGTPLTDNADDTTVHFGVDNRIVLKTASRIARLQSDGVSNWTQV